MKICYVFDTIFNSNAGVQQYFKGLARYFIGKGHEIRFIVPAYTEENEFKGMVYAVGSTINPPLLNTTSVPVAINFNFKKIQKIFKDENFDIVHIGSPYSPFLGERAILYAKCPIVSTYMVYSKNKLRRFFTKILRIFQTKSYKKINYFIASTEATKEDAEYTYPGKYEIIPLGVDITRYSPLEKPLEQLLKKDYINIFSVNRLEDRKGYTYLIDAFKIVQKECPNTQLFIAGDGPLRSKLENQIKKLKLKNAYLLGYIDEDLKSRYFASSDICVFPSIYGECFGVVLIEAFASGKTTIGFGNEGYKQVLDPFPDLIVENKNVQKLAEKIIKYVKNSNLRLKTNDQLLDYSKQFSWENVGSRIEKIYQSLLNN